MTEQRKRFFAVAVTHTISDAEEDEDNGQVLVMSCVVAAPTKLEAQKLARFHFCRCLYFPEDAALAYASVEIELTIPELIDYIPGLAIRTASEETSWDNASGVLKMTGFGNPGPVEEGSYDD